MSYRIPNSKPWITPDDVIAVSRAVHAAGWGEQPGSEVAAFERELAEFLGRKYVVCVSSGTVALELACRAAFSPVDEPRDRIAFTMPAFGFIATPNALVAAGHTPQFNDRERRHAINSWVLGETVPCGLDVDGEVMQGSVTDACQAFGAKLPASLADCYSFNWNKPITCLGGGCVATDDVGLACDVEALRNQGRYPLDRNAGWNGNCTILGTNARLSDMQAALGRSQLRRVGEILERRRQVADWYQQTILTDHGHLQIPVDGCMTRKSWFLYPIELSNRDEVHAKMLAKGIQTRSCADWLLPAHPYYAEKYGYKRGKYPEAERRADRTLLLPLFPEMTLEQVQEVCRALEECDARA